MLRITKLLSVFALLVTLALPAGAQDEPAWLQVNEDDLQPRKASKVGHEADASFSYAGDANVKQGNRTLGELDSFHSSVNYVATFPLSETIHGRAGFTWDRHSFGLPGGSLLPNTLQQTSLNLGFDAELGDKWIMRFEVSPGIYSDFQDISAKDFNIPIILGFSYLVDSKLQWVFGLSADFRREIPVLPGVGVRWQFADNWTLNAIFPQPKLEYQIDESLMVYLGADLKGGSYAVEENFGNSIGQPELNNEIVEYMEARAGVGVGYKIHPSVTLNAEAGGVFYRSFDYANEDLTIKSSEPAPYGAISISAQF